MPQTNSLKKQQRLRKLARRAESRARMRELKATPPAPAEAAKG